MAISEADRADLYAGLVETLGSRRAETLMSAIPLYDLDQVATKADLQVLASDLRAEMAELRAEFHTEIGALRKTMTNWMLTQSVAVIGAIVGVAFLT
jgi:hypothetical protein